MQCNIMQGLYAQLTGEHLRIWCSGMQGLYSHLTWEDLYICLV